jgi:phospholipase/carboxylesterase
VRPSELASLVTASVLAASLAAGCHRHDDPPEHRAPPRPPKEHKAPAAHADDGAQTIAGLRFLEVVTGGAAAGDRLPLVVFLHAHSARPPAVRAKLAAFPGKARIVVPFGLHEGDKGSYVWFPGPQFTPEGEKAYARALPDVEKQVAAAIAAIAEARPTLGKPIASGFSQGAGIALAIALWHPDLLSAACPMAGELPPGVFDGASAPAAKPEVHALIGDTDLMTPSAERTIAGFKSLGYAADLKVLPGFGHTFDPSIPEVFACLARATSAAK